MAPAHHAKIVISEDGKLSLDQLPFRAGQVVEVIVLPVTQPAQGDHSLKGTVICYDRPFEPVAEQDWGALR